MHCQRLSSVKAWCYHFAFQVCSIGPYPNILKSFPLWITLSNITRFCFWLTFSWDTCGWEARMRKNFWVVKGKQIHVDGHWRERREYSSPVNFQSIKMKCVYNNYVQRCDIYVPILSICNQLISIYLSIAIKNRYQSITTWIFAFDWSLIININRLVDIDWYWLISIVIDCLYHRLDTPGLAVSMLRRKQDRMFLYPPTFSEI